MIDSHAAANTIIAQLGGRRFIAMTGAKNFGYGTNDGGMPYLSFKLPSARHFVRDGINYVRVDLTPEDLYRVEFGTVRGGKRLNYTIKHEVDGLYSEDLPMVFEDVTGLCTSL